jgi:hypothetical protein
MDGAAEPASEKHMPPAPNFVKVVAVNRQRGMGLCPPEWQITQQELHELDLGKPVNIPRDRWEPISQHHLYAEFLTSAPVEIWQ